MDIPELSMAMASGRLSQNISYALMAKVLDTAEVAGEELIEMRRRRWWRRRGWVKTLIL